MKFEGIEALQNTYAFAFPHEEAEVVGPSLDTWQSLSPNQIAVMIDNITLESKADEDIVRQYEVMPECVFTEGISPQEQYLRKWILHQVQSKDLHNPGYPYGPLPVDGQQMRCLPAALAYSYVADRDTGLLTGKMYFQRHPEVPSGNAFWSYINRVFTEANGVLVPGGLHPLALHQDIFEYASIDSTRQDEPIDGFT